MKFGLKNILLLLLFFFSVHITTKCQTKEPGLLVADSKPFITDLKLKKNEKVLVYRYGHIVIKDMRPDTSKMGYVKLEAKAKPHRIDFPKVGAGYINEIFNNAIEPVQKLDTLIIVLNDIWFNETRTEAVMAHKLLLGAEKLVSSCFLNADFYIHNEAGFDFIGNYDSIVSKKGEWLPNNCDKLLEKVAAGLLVKADNLLAETNPAKELYSREQFDSIMESRFQYPILQTEKLLKGVYFSYSDFLNNDPAQINFTLLSEKNKSIDYPGRNAGDTSWGYCDGENIYMHIANAYYRLYKTQNTFEVIGPATVEIMNSFFEKALRVAVDYYTSPRIPYNYFSPIRARWVDPTPLFEPNKFTIQYYKFFQMNMKNGYLN